MSRSYKKEPYESCNAGSFKAWKQLWNKIHRHRCKIKLNTCKDWDSLVLPIFDESSNIWDSPKDGRMRRQEIPALNQCELDLESRARYYGRDWAVRRWKFKDGHFESCECYSNKRSYYWKMMRK